MITKLSVYKSLLLIVLFLPSLSQAKDAREFDILVSPEREDFFFYMNVGGELVENPFAPRPAGANYILNGEIYPKGTISKHQENFNFDRHGRELRHPIGTFFCIANVTENLAFDPMGFPEQGSLAELVTWEFHFRKECDGQSNTVVAIGSVQAGTIESNKEGQNPVGFRAQDLAVVGTTGCNYAIPNVLEKAKAYLSPTGQILLVVKFKNEIQYRE
jgi:hypothetical protein